MNKHDDLVEAKVTILAGKCGHHHQADCAGCVESLALNNRMLADDRATIQSLTERVAELEAKGECLALTIEGLSKLVGKADYQPEALVNWRATLSNGETK